MGDLPLIVDLTTPGTSKPGPYGPDSSRTESDPNDVFSNAPPIGTAPIVPPPPPSMAIFDFSASTSRQLPALPTTLPLAHSSAAATAVLAPYVDIARKFSSSAPAIHGGAIPVGSEGPIGRGSTAGSLEMVKQRVEAFASRLTTETVSAWELPAPLNRSAAPMWQRKLLATPSTIRWSNVHQPVMVLQRFTRRMRQRRQIRDAVRFHMTSAASQKRVQLLVDMIQSEQRYVAKLQLMTESMMPQLARSPEFDMAVFGNIPKIEYIHRELLGAFRKRQQNCWLEMRIGDLFAHQLVPRLVLYVQYAAQHAVSALQLRRSLERNPVMRQHVRRAEAVAGVAGPSLEQLLELPLSRLQYYSKALQQLLLVLGSDPGEEEYFSMSLAVVAVQQALAAVRAHVAAAEQQRTCAMLQSSLGVQLPSGHAKQHGQLRAPSAPGSWYFVLLDQWLIGACRAGPHGFEVKYKLGLGDAALEQETAGVISVCDSQLRTRAIGEGNAFVVSDGAANLALVAGSIEEKVQWVHSLEGLIKEARRRKAAEALESDLIKKRRLEAHQKSQMLQSRLLDEQQITDKIGVRALGVLEGLSEKLEIMTEQLETYEETILWPEVVGILLDQLHNDSPARQPVAVVQEQFDRLTQLDQLEAGVSAADDVVLRKAQKLVQAECTKDAQLLQMGKRCWEALEQQFGNFFSEMSTLEEVMDSDIDTSKAALLSEADQLRQQICGLDHKMLGVQDEAEELSTANLALAREIAEQNEELQILNMRLRAL